MVCHHDVEGGSCPAEREVSALLGGAQHGSSSQASCSFCHSSVVLPRCAREHITETRRAATCSPVSVSLTPAREVRGALTLKLGASAVRLMRRMRRSLSKLLWDGQWTRSTAPRARGMSTLFWLAPTLLK